jgi:hypothetical protein
MRKTNRKWINGGRIEVGGRALDHTGNDRTSNRKVRAVDMEASEHAFLQESGEVVSSRYRSNFCSFRRV